ncbi:hypothetical protein [Streptomyces sp. WL006]|uniref:hypothetical protein n=1 Tax=Streptomyces sp. WL006 TaxID=3423915 RepID=UPI003F6C26E3
MTGSYPRATRRGAALDWVKFDAELARDGSVDTVDKALYAAIGSFVDAETRESPVIEEIDPNNIPDWVPTRKRLAECIGKSVDTVDRSSKRLESRGLLRIHRQPDPANPRRMLPSEYELLDHHVWDERAAERAARRALRRSANEENEGGGGRTDAATPGRTPAATPGRTGAAVKDLEEEEGEIKEEPAPAARSAGDARRASAGSSAHEGLGGSAATTETGPVATDVEGPVGRKPKAGTKPSPFPAEVRERIYATERLLPEGLRLALADLLPHGHLPNVNRRVIAQALETREPAELGERAARRWISYGYERDFHDGLLRKPLGVVEELLRPTPYCPDPECEDGTRRGTEDPCVPCETRVRQRIADRRAGRAVPTQRPPRLYRDAEQCQVCDQPFRDRAPDDLICRSCRESLARAAAHANGEAPPAPAPEPDPEHCAAPPSDEFRRYRQQQAAAKTARHARSAGPAPF